MQAFDRILLSRMKYIGDIVLTTPLIRALREKFPSAYIAYLGDKRAVSLLEHNPYLDEIIAFDFTRPTLLEQPRVAWELRKRKFDVFIDLFSNPRTAMLARLSGAPMRIGKDVPGRGKLYTHRIGDYGALQPAIDFHYQYLKPLGVPMSHRKTEIFITDDERREARIFLRHQGLDLDRPVVALHPGASWPNKMWPKERFAALIDLLRAKLGAEVLLSPGPGDEELVRFIADASVGSVVALPVLPVRELAAVFSLCRVLVANDCGPMHIGVAVGTRTIGIFGPEPPEVWFSYPAADGHLPLFRKIECSPCRATSCHRTGEGFLECMKLIAVGEVFDAVKARIDPVT
jgi:ADP-heptose:LPS heptosyltransferase